MFVCVQQLGQLPRVDSITLAPVLQQGIPARIADHGLLDVWLQQVVQPGGPGPFFQGHVQFPTQSLHKLHNGDGFRRDNRFHYQLARSI